MQKHIYTIHDGHKDHKCESCGKSFSQAENLKRHIQTVHEDHKDYRCESCDKSFSQAEHLKKHIHTVHEGNKDYKCISCGKLFSQAGSLNKHTCTQQVFEGYKVPTEAEKLNLDNDIFKESENLLYDYDPDQD